MSQSNEHVADFVDDYLHRLLDAAAVARVKRHCAACPACEAALEEARRRRAALKTAPPVEAPTQLVQKTLRKIDAHQQSRQRRWRRFVWITGGALAASILLLTGLYVYNSHLSATPYDLVVLGQRDLLASTNASLRVLLRDGKTFAPLSGVPVTVQLLDHANNKTTDLATFTTDAHGDGQPRFTLPDWPDGSYDLHVVAQTAGAPETSSQTVSLKRSSRVMLTTDKPVYQPGQVIHARALALRRPDLHPVAEQTAAFSVVDPRGNVIFKQEGKTSRYGIAAADCALDTEIQDGAYTILCKIGDVESRLSVEVKKYVLPKFKVVVTSDQPFYKPGDTIKLKVQADYFFGKPVADAAVDVDVTQEMPGRKPAHLTAHTDAKGTASVEFAAEAPQDVQPMDRLPDPWHVHFLVTVVDSAGQKQTAAADPAVSTWPARMDVISEAGVFTPGVENTLYVLVTHLDGRPAGRVHVALTYQGLDNLMQAVDEDGAAAFEVTPAAGNRVLKVSAVDDTGAEIARREVWMPCDPANDFLVRTDKAVYHAGDTMTLTAVGGHIGSVYVDLIKEGQTLLTETIEMDYGKGEAVVDLPADLTGTVQVVGYRLDAKGWPVRKTRVVYVQPADQVHIAAALDPGKKTYKPGDRPTLRLKLTDKDGKPCPGAVSLAGVDEAVFSVLPQRPGSEQAFYTLEQDLMEPTYKIHPWSPDEVHSERYEAALFAAASRADMTYQNEGIGPEMPHQIPPFLSDAVAPALPIPTHSLMAQTYQTKVEQTEELRQVRLDMVKWGWVLLVIAAIATAVAGFWLFARTSVLVKSLATGYVVLPFLVIGFVVCLGVEQRSALGVAAAKAIPVGGRVGQPTVFTKDVTPTMAPPAADPDLSNIDVGSDPQVVQNAAPEPRVRERFPETLLWRPELITDDDGTASLPLDLADSITTWRLSASAVSADGKLGAAQLPVQVFQDFFVDLNLPIALTRGDEVGVPVVVYNYLDKPQTVALVLADGDWFTRLDGAEQRLDLAPGEVRSVRYRLRVEKVGVYTLTVAARGADESDAVQRVIEIDPDGRRVEQVVNGTLEKPVDAALELPENRIPGSEKAFVKIYPSSFSQLVEGLDNIFQMPYGCFEQTSSTTYPSVLALDYLKRTHQSAPAVEARARGFIHLGYQRLLGFEVQGGGFDWFGQAPANRTLTAYGLMEFMDMARVHDVDPRLIERTRRWLLDQRRPDGSWDPEVHKMHDDAVAGATADDARLAETAYIAWAVFGDPAASGQAPTTLAYLKGRRPENIKDPHTLALVCNALLAVDAHNADAVPYLDRLEALKHVSDDGKFAWWEQAPGARTTFYGAGRSGSVETTALATLALIRAGRNPAVTRQALTWLTSQKDAHGAWYSTQATVLALKALLAGTGAPLGGDGERFVEVRLNGDVVGTVQMPADQAEVMKQVDLSALLKPGKQVVRLSEANGAAVGFQLSFRYNEPDAGPAEKKDPLAVALTYDRTELAVGEQIQATAQVVNRTDRSASMVMVELPSPAGFAPSMDDFTALVKPGGKVAKYQVRPRSVLLYLTGLEAGEALKVTYHLRATTPLKATAAGVRAYEYYDPDTQGSSPGTQLTVHARD